MKTYVITGTTSGIGKALLKALCKDNIVFAGYRKFELEDNLKSLSDNVIPFFIDMENKTSIRLAADFILSKTDKIDSLYNVAGCVVAGAVENIDIDDIRKQFEINTFSQLDFSQQLLDALEGGRIINISSMSSFGIFPFISPYSASKRAMDILFNAMQLETHRNVKIISVKPGVIATPIWQKSIILNEKSIQFPKSFEKEMKYMVANAQNNSKNGLDVQKVVDVLLKIEKTHNPKASYTIGFDAKIAEMFSKLPQDVLNFIIKFKFAQKLSSKYGII